MPVSPNRDPIDLSALPEFLQSLLRNIAVSPVSTAVEAGPPMLQSLGKEVSELLGAEFTHTPHGSGTPQRIRFTNIGSGGQMQFHGVRSDAPVFQAAPGEVDEAINSGLIDLRQPPSKLVNTLRAQLAQLLGPAPPK